ncbi:phospholipase D-like domain-containing protein [Uliginosibacterium sp. H1]|uniref:phospholipase D-like domain-containing protein n=1 Tax=Uliginosibacterium sp. H1 TaxID=3114757 RepID=UPI002E16DC8B|nr:phospholipase D-like domain-containing protein [Uliginosibacterium sp. H1]
MKRSEWKSNHRVNLLPSSEVYLERLCGAVATANREVLIEADHLRDDVIGRALAVVLIGAAQRGLRVSVTLQSMGSSSQPSPFIKGLIAAGVKIQSAETYVDGRPCPPRKLAVVDGERAFLGGFSFDGDAPVGAPPVQEYGAELVGPLVESVRLLLFARLAGNRHPLESERRYARRGRAEQPGGEGWACLVSGDEKSKRGDVLRHYLEAIRHAEQDIVLASAYFTPGWRLMKALTEAAARGVRVRLVVQHWPRHAAARWAMKQIHAYLLRHGVEMLSYRRSLLHGSVGMVDDQWATICSGSQNMETHLVVRDRQFNAALRAHLHGLMCFDCKLEDEARLPQGVGFLRALAGVLTLRMMDDVPRLPSQSRPAYTPARTGAAPIGRTVSGHS